MAGLSSALRAALARRVAAGESEAFVRAELKGLDMSLAARMQRAREMGFDVDASLYHGTDQNIQSFRPTSGWYGSGVAASRSPDIAKFYAWRTPHQARGGLDDAPNIMPILARGRLAPIEEFNDVNRRFVSRYEMTNPKTQAELQRRGYEGVDVGGPDDEILVFDPRNVRSIHAAFDPDERGSADLMAALPLAIGGAAGGGLTLREILRNRMMGEA